MTRLYELLPVFGGYIVPNKQEAAWDYLVNPVFDLKQSAAKAMASGHTHEVCPESGTMTPGLSLIWKTKDIQQPEPVNLIIFLKNHTHFFLHDKTAVDINSIVKIIVTGPDQRHCSNNVLSIIPLAGKTASTETKIFG